MFVVDWMLCIWVGIGIVVMGIWLVFVIVVGIVIINVIVFGCIFLGVGLGNMVMWIMGCKL